MYACTWYRIDICPQHAYGSFDALIIGLTLTLVHILEIGLTDTSVNTARSIGSAIAAAINGKSASISCVWVFIIGPLIGATIAAGVHIFFENSKSAKNINVDLRTCLKNFSSAGQIRLRSFFMSRLLTFFVKLGIIILLRLFLPL